MLRLLRFVTVIMLLTNVGRADDARFPLDAKRILFLGDSITHAGHYIAIIEAQMLVNGVDPMPELINLGLPSETCTGLSEPDHPFPRPNVHERIGRALDKIKPDVVVACYGMNDGIYYPFDQQRFAAYQAGIGQIIVKVHAAQAKLILLTPPAFDPLPLRKSGKLLPTGQDKYAWFAIYEDYDDVLQKYAAWIMQQKDRVAMTVDLHTPVTRYVAGKREQDETFTMSPDGVHVNNEGHAVLAATIMKAWGVSTTETPDSGLQELVSRRQKLMHDALLGDVGHQRPGMQPGLPLNDARSASEELSLQIKARIARGCL